MPERLGAEILREEPETEGALSLRDTAAETMPVDRTRAASTVLLIPARSPTLTTAQAASAKYRPDVDGLRAIAVIPVLFFHTGVSLSSGG
jgi:hypothetical protein